MNFNKTDNKVIDMMIKHSARRIAEVDGPNKSSLQFWALRGGVCIVQLWRGGGCSHYVEGTGTSWDEMEADLARLAAR